MAQVRVYNDNKYEFKQVFIDEEIVIPAGGFITMEKKRAIQFKSYYSPIEIDADGQPTPRSMKMIRLEDIKSGEPDVDVEKFKCMACDKQFQTQKALDQHIDASHVEQLADKEYVEKKNKEKK